MFESEVPCVSSRLRVRLLQSRHDFDQTPNDKPEPPSRHVLISRFEYRSIYSHRVADSGALV